MLGWASDVAKVEMELLFLLCRKVIITYDYFSSEAVIFACICFQNLLDESNERDMRDAVGVEPMTPTMVDHSS